MSKLYTPALAERNQHREMLELYTQFMQASLKAVQQYGNMLNDLLKIGYESLTNMLGQDAADSVFENLDLDNKYNDLEQDNPLYSDLEKGIQLYLNNMSDKKPYNGKNAKQYIGEKDEGQVQTTSTGYK